MERTGAETLDITHGCMASRTAKVVYHTFVEGQNFLLQYFDHIKHSELLNHILAKFLNDSLAEAFFGHIAEQVSSNNLTFIQVARLIPKEAFHYLLVVLTSDENNGVSVRRTRDEKPGKYFHSKIDDNDQSDQSHLLWMFFHAQHDSLCTTDTLRRGKSNSGKELPNMSYIGDLNSCESFLDRISIDKPNNEEANALSVAYVALKSRKMKTLRDFQKRRYGTAPTVIGQHGTRMRTAIPEISGLFLHQQEQEEQDYLKDNVDANSRDDINGILFETGEVVVFRGKDGLDFNLLKITKNVKFGVTPQTKIKRNFLLKSNTLEDGSVLFVEDPLWKGVTMAFVHILRDTDESIVTVNLIELNMLHGTFYKMETFHESVSVSQDFENSLEKKIPLFMNWLKGFI